MCVTQFLTSIGVREPRGLAYILRSPCSAQYQTCKQWVHNLQCRSMSKALICPSFQITITMLASDSARTITTLSAMPCK